MHLQSHLNWGSEIRTADDKTLGCSFNYRQEHQSLLEKLSALEKKVIVGGVDLLAKAEEQEKLLEESNMELEERRRRAEQLRKELEEKEVAMSSVVCAACSPCPKSQTKRKADYGSFRRQ